METRSRSKPSQASIDDENALHTITEERPSEMRNLDDDVAHENLEVPGAVGGLEYENTSPTFTVPQASSWLRMPFVPQIRARSAAQGVPGCRPPFGNFTTRDVAGALGNPPMQGPGVERVNNPRFVLGMGDARREPRVDDIGNQVQEAVGRAMGDVTKTMREMLGVMNRGLTNVVESIDRNRMLGRIDRFQEVHPPPRAEVNPNGGPQQNPDTERRGRHDDTSSDDEHRDGYSSRGTMGSRSSRVSDRPRQMNHEHSTKLPVFDGKEKWNVWYNRFNDVALMKGWGNAEKLNHLLPRLQGAAGEFVFGQLNQTTRQNFDELVKELESRFRCVETCKTYAARFSHRSQNPQEKPEEYAAELKRLYDKAFPRRDANTRQEDLLRRFLDGLMNEKARFHVEYVKEPQDIDGAVYEVVNYMETTRGPDFSNKKMKYTARSIDDSQNDSHEICDDEDQNLVSRVQGRSAPKTASVPKAKQGSTEEKSPDVATEISRLKDDMKDLMSKFEQRLVNLERAKFNRPRYSDGKANQVICYRCNEQGHYAKDCPTLASKQSNVTSSNNRKTQADPKVTRGTTEVKQQSN